MEIIAEHGTVFLILAIVFGFYMTWGIGANIFAPIFNSGALKAQAEVVDKLAHDYVASMVATGRTLVQIISEPTKPLAFLTTLHNLLEHTLKRIRQSFLK